MKEKPFSLVRSVFLQIVFLTYPWHHPAFGGEGYSEPANRLGYECKDILGKHILCKDINCATVFWVGNDKHLYVEVYEVSDLEAIEDITDACLKEYKRSGQLITIELSLYRVSHEEVMGLFKGMFIKPYIHLMLRGRN